MPKKLTDVDEGTRRNPKTGERHKVSKHIKTVHTTDKKPPKKRSVADIARLADTSGAGSATMNEALPARQWKNEIGNILRHTREGDSKPILSCVMMTQEDDGLRMLACNGNTLAVRKVEGLSIMDEGEQIIVNRDDLKAFAKKVSVGGGEVFMATDGSELRLSHSNDKGEHESSIYLKDDYDVPDFEALIADAREVRQVSYDFDSAKMLTRLEEVKGEQKVGKNDECVVGVVQQADGSTALAWRNEDTQRWERNRLLEGDLTKYKNIKTAAAAADIDVDAAVLERRQAAHGYGHHRNAEWGFSYHHLKRSLQVADGQRIKMTLGGELHPSLIEATGGNLALLMPKRWR